MSRMSDVGYALLEGTRQYHLEFAIISAFEKPECKYIVDMPAGYKLEREPDYKNPCW
jgi:hypothetical protein